jgi:hypothetical protein
MLPQLVSSYPGTIQPLDLCFAPKIKRVKEREKNEPTDVRCSYYTHAMCQDHAQLVAAQQLKQ